MIPVTRPPKLDEVDLSITFMGLNCNFWCLCSLCLHDMLKIFFSCF